MRVIILLSLLIGLIALGESGPNCNQRICPMNYQPVCGQRVVDGKLEKKDFSNACLMTAANDCDEGWCACDDTRPCGQRACNKMYSPVCAERTVDGVFESKKFSNKCMLAAKNDCGGGYKQVECKGDEEAKENYYIKPVEATPAPEPRPNYQPEPRPDMDTPNGSRHLGRNLAGYPAVDRYPAVFPQYMPNFPIGYPQRPYPSFIDPREQ